jgi:quercetin dioxygenase-like cupin family protein
MKLMPKCVVIAVFACSAGLASGGAFAAGGNETPMPLAMGTLTSAINSTTKVDGGRVRVQTKGTLEVFFVQVTIPPGGKSAWHSHAGPRFGVVKQGTLTVVRAKGCKTQTLQAGQAIYDGKPSDTEIVLNRGSEPVVVVQAFLLPKGKTPDIDQPAPANCPV